MNDLKERAPRPYIIDLGDIALISEEVPMYCGQAVPDTYVFHHPAFCVVNSGETAFSTQEDTAYFEQVNNIGYDLWEHRDEMEYPTNISDINCGYLGAAVMLASPDRYPLALRSIFSAGGETLEIVTHHNQYTFGRLLQIDGPGSIKMQQYNPIFYNYLLSFLEQRTPSLSSNLDLLIDIVADAELPNRFQQHRDIAFLKAIRAAALEYNIAAVSPFRQYEEFCKTSYKKECAARAMARTALELAE